MSAASKIDVRQVEAAITPPSYQSYSEGSVSCPANTKLVGGGCSCNSFGPILQISNSPDPFTAGVWRCKFRNDGLQDVSNVNAYAYAICLSF